MKKVFITSNIPKAGLSLLKDKFQLTFHEPLDRQITEEELIEASKNHDAIITILSDPVTERVISAGGDKLKIVANYGAGFNNIDIDTCKKRNVQATNTPGVLHKTTADLTFAMILSIARRLKESEQFLRDGNFGGWKPDLFLGSDIHNKTLGIIGLGEIGQEVAKRAKGFNMKTLYYKRTQLSQKEEQELNVNYASFEHILSESDFLSLHVPLTEKTHHLISKDEFVKMKNDAFLINTSRGPVVDESALVKALETNQIRGAALDVFEEEPKVHNGLLNREDCLLLPHIGSATQKCRDDMSILTCKNVLAVLEGKEPLTPVV
ncbi:2-hydroxyacid dehydrogenase [Natranaerobius trueperi]|uniref:D-glycerate dehydrogenase n=1 Tax=Natranaerobius trueperi TaxID=759412 RepID=A0A226BXZ0_9FIRM|nr:D-glycerate dehydrogenase [Natranaerobius trueperi]OWZ83805.1 D-glycerate dehydrogenase [Natranaerobius trueperi]